LKEQNKYDQVPLCIFDRLQRILDFADKVAEEIVGEETGILEKTIPRMFEVMQMVAKFSCNYVKRGRFGEQSSFMELTGTNNRRESGGWADPPRDNRRNG
jgi:hypothetical protein